ncbi:hypothetical protein, partial [Plesiomonas shigelloides]|uniref:hypothetical protein n=1 Tax=Plesiomonas shigelloides TaxID=703 RepID=UPI00224825E5
GFCDFNVIAVLSSLFPTQRYPLFAFLSQRLLTLFSVLSFSIGLNRRRQRIRRYVALLNDADE